ncbi:MAG TPA: hypothetical protein VIK61_09655 [Acidimicrobiia bacterium]
MTIPGTYSATAMFAVGIPFDVVVRGLIDEIGLTRDEAVMAATAAQHGPLVEQVFTASSLDLTGMSGRY